MKNFPEKIIVGLGSSGISTANYLQSNNKSFVLADNYPTTLDIKSLQKKNIDTKLYMGDFSKKLFKSAKTLIVNPAISINKKAIKAARKNGVEVIGDIELFAREMVNYSAKLVAITGTNGKSTCVSLLQQMALNAGLNSKLGGNIGVPALDLLGDKSTELFILELSSFQLETTNSLNCDVAAILNITPDHLDRYQSYQDYIEAKKRLIKQTKNLVVFNDDHQTNKLRAKGKTIKFTLDKPKEDEFGIYQDKLCKGKTELISCKQIALKGKHNLANALSCLAIGELIGLPKHAMLSALKSFTGLPHRTQFVCNIKGSDWINDSKATNVGATIASINSFASGKNIILIAGGQTKGADLQPLTKVCEQHVADAILFGQDAHLLENTLKNSTECHLVDDLEEACQLAYNKSEPAKTVLFAPAGASFDMFINYQARGDEFINITRSMA